MLTHDTGIQELQQEMRLESRTFRCSVLKERSPEEIYHHRLHYSKAAKQLQHQKEKMQERSPPLRPGSAAAVLETAAGSGVAGARNRSKKRLQEDTALQLVRSLATDLETSAGWAVTREAIQVPKQKPAVFGHLKSAFQMALTEKPEGGRMFGVGRAETSMFD